MSGVNNVLLSFFFSVALDDDFKQSILRELQDEKADKVCVCVHVSISQWLLYHHVKM